MALTEEHNAFRLRKLRTCFNGLDVDNDGYITTEDFEEMAKRFIEYGKLDEKRRTGITKSFLDICQGLGVKDGDKMTLEQYLAGGLKLCENPRGPEMTKILMSMNFDVVDVNGDGIISPEEFRLYFWCMGIGESHAKASFEGIDTDHDGLISKEEFVAASIEFFYGFDTTSGAVLFYGPLVD